MEIWQYGMLPVVGFIIGYFTNYIAIKMLFHPRKVKFGLQGVFPKRKADFARNVSEVVIHVLPKKIRDLEKIPFVGPGMFDMIKGEIEREINAMPNAELEKLVMKVIRRELGFITWMGGALGFFIGLVQVGLLLL
ncbi:MAG: uncharacterized membrane protein YheB (UPF0754 family) [Patescibacteria group bacterium]|jgi:uncharacterized membrane protein YheB (UPF0754 family)